MRQKQITGDKQMQRTQRKEPLAETIQKKRRKPRNWKAMTDEELISFARGFVQENGIKTRSGLQKIDVSLYQVLKERNLLDTIISSKRRDWASMSDEEVLSYAKKFIEENGIKIRRGLQKIDVSLCQVLRKRNLLDKIIPDKMHRDWSSMSDEELISYARKIIEENGIKGRKELSKKDGSLYYILRKRKLLDIFMPKKCRGTWTSMSDEDILFYGKKLIEGKNIPNVNILRKIDGSLFYTLLGRGLLEVVFPDKRVCRKWISKTNEEVMEYANDSIRKNKIKNRAALEKLDPGLINVLRYRGLLDIVIPDKRIREWSKMSDEKVISYAENLIEKKGISTRPKLNDEDTGLYRILYKRGLMDAILPSSKRNWFLMSDKELIQYAKIFIKESTRKSRRSLQRIDPGLYHVLRKRNLLSTVFSDIEQARKTEAVKQVVDAMKEFGEKE